MKTCLRDSNPWLREPGRRAELLRISAASSSAVAGIAWPFRLKAAPAGTLARQRPKTPGPARG